MRFHSRLKWFFAVSVIALATGPAGAQSPPGSNAPPPTENVGQVQFGATPKLSPDDMEKQADALLEQMQSTATRIGRRQLKAAADADVVLANCLKDKLSQIDSAVRSAKERRASLRNPDIGSHAFTIIVVQKGNSDRAAREANQCIGKEATTAGETRVTTTIDNTLPPDDTNNQFPTVDPPTVIVVPPPPPASPIR
jgi:hypothetical protein